MSGTPRWYQEAILYELHVRAFYDSNGDGMGDFKGLTEKLEYIRDLGVTAIWVLPFYPSPWKDDGYDIADYTGVHPAFGSLRDFRAFLREAHRHGLKVITELVLNHTSDQHPWFRRARTSEPGTADRDFYVWSESPDRYKEARIIFKDFEVSNWAWDADARAYYWHRFYAHQPDLNFNNPDVRRAMLGVCDFWFEMGVDGMRLDAVPYLFERDGTSCENLPETHGFLKELRAHVDSRYEDRMLLAEANQWPEDAAAYFGDGDECHMAFHFPVMPRMFMAVRMEDRFPIIDILQQTPAIPSNAQWALFLRNHDELTLEMVTDEERDYMYRVYAHDPQMRVNLGIRRRLAPLLGSNRRQIELMNGLLFSLPGAPVIYYGDEIGMGDNIYLGDRNAVRTPMQWSADRNAGFSRANPQRLYLPVIIDPEYHAEAINVEAQQNNPHSLLWWTRHLIALRKRYPALARGSVEFLYAENRKVLAFVRALGDENILVVANLSRYVQAAELDLARYKGSTPVELFGSTDFPKIGDLPYFLTLGPHSFYWFALQPEQAEAAVTGPRAIPTVDARSADLTQLLPMLSGALPSFLRAQRWFGGKSRRIKSATVSDVVPVEGPEAVIAIAQVAFIEGDPHTYALPLIVSTGKHALDVEESFPNAVLARLRISDGEAVVHDGLGESTFAQRLLEMIERRRRARSPSGELQAIPMRTLRGALAGVEEPLPTTTVRVEQSNTSVIFGDRLILKLFRRLEEGENPDLEIGRFLTEERRFPHTPAVAGSITYRTRAGGPSTLAILQQYIPNEGDAWSYTVDQVDSYLERALTLGDERLEEPSPDVLRLAREDVPEAAYGLIGVYLESARLLGQRTAELHVALAAEHSDPAFAPEPITPFYRQALYQSMRKLAREVFVSLRRTGTPDAEQILPLEESILERFRVVLERPRDGLLTRTHGDYHLGQVLYTGKDFVIIDFEGEPSRSLSARRIKRSPIADVAAMIRSFHYAAYSSVQRRADVLRPEQAETLEPLLSFWHRWVSGAFLRSYLDVAGDAAFLPRDPDDLRALFEVFLLEKAVYELGYEANNRPSWLSIPARGIQHLVALREPGEG